MAPIIIDDETKLNALLFHIEKRVLKEKDQLMFVDLEGVDLGRTGKVAIMQLLLPPVASVYLVDVHLLGARAFETTTADGTSLKSVLESKCIFKVFFDIRNDSDALHAHFDIHVAGIIDLQILEYVTRTHRGKFVNGLARCIASDLPYNPGWSITKDKGRRLFAPELGGTYEVFLRRPMADDIITYCEQDVLLMPRLLVAYGRKLRTGLAAQVQGIVDERIRVSKTSTYNGKGRHKAVGPYLAPVGTYSNMTASQEVNLVRSTRLGYLCRLDDSNVDDLISSFQIVHVGTKVPEQASDESLSLAYTTTSSPQNIVDPYSMTSSRSANLLPKPANVEDTGDLCKRSRAYTSAVTENAGL